MLNSKLTSLRTLSTTVTVSADDPDASMFTPRTQAYWVIALRARYASWLGMRARSGRKVSDRAGDARSVENCSRMEFANGMKRGRERKCYIISFYQFLFVFHYYYEFAMRA